MEDIILMQEGDAPLASFIEKGLVAAWSAKGKNNTDTDRNILKDLSGQGHNITLYGFAYNDESGYSSKYPNALLFDGKSTYGECTNMPIQTDYTIIAKRRILEKITKGPCFMSKAQTVGVGAFMFELQDSANTVQMYSFNQASAYFDPITPITYSTSTNFNGHNIIKGSASDTNYLCLGNARKGDINRAWHGAFYWAALFNKSLITEEIDEFIKVMETPVGTKISICASKTRNECIEDSKLNLGRLYFPTDSDSIFFNNKEYCHHPGKIVDGGEIFNHSSNTITGSGVNNHVEGQGTSCMSSNCSHAEGMNTICSSTAAHSEGQNTIAVGVGSHAEGVGTAISVEGGHVEGKYNAVTDSIHIIGGGTSNDNRKNIHEIKSDGKQYVIGVGGYNGTNRDSATDLATIIGEFKAPYIIGFISYASTPADDKLPELLGKPSDVRAAVQDGRPILMVNSTFSTPVTVYCSGTASMTFTWTYCGTSTTRTKIISMRVSYNNTSDTFTTVSTKSTYSLTADA